jgi:hypothetical protein
MAEVNMLCKKVLDEAIAKMQHMLSEDYVAPQKEYLLITSLEADILTDEFFVGIGKNVQYEEWFNMRHYYKEK